MNKFKTFIGIDVSKSSLDVCVLLSSKETKTIKIPNSKRGLSDLLIKLEKLSVDLQSTLFCSENTGIYNVILQDFCVSHSLFYWEENALQIKRSMGFVRGKNDIVDSYRIAMYAQTHQSRVCLFVAIDSDIKRLKHLSVLRKNLLKSRVQIRQVFTEKKFIDKEILEMLDSKTSPVLAMLGQQIEDCEKEMLSIIRANKGLAHLYRLITSVPGIGVQTAVNTLIITNGFTRIQTPKQFACYVGVAPFEYRSGSSIMYKAKVSTMANKQLKTLFHMASISVIQRKGELQDYYHRKVGEGKNKMSVINAVRNKIIHRMYACVKNDKLYVNKLVMS